MKRATLLLSLAGVLALLAAGCGGGGGERLSKAEFITAADAVCTKYDKQGDEIDFPDVDLDKNPSDADLDTFGDALEQIGDIFDEQIDELDALNPPEADQELFDEALDHLRDASGKIKEAAGSAHDNDVAAVKKSLSEGETSSDAADKIGQQYGFKVCGADN